MRDILIPDHPLSETWIQFQSLEFQKTLRPPYYAAIFTNLRSGIDENYTIAADQMIQLTENQKGYLGHESTRKEVGITVSYWRDLESIRRWKLHTEDLAARQKGKKLGYRAYKTRIEIDNEFER